MKYTIKSSRRFSIGFRRISRLKLCFHLFAMIQTCRYLYSSNFIPQVKQARNQSQILIGNRFHVKLLIISYSNRITCKDWWWVVLREIDFILKFVIDSLLIPPVEWSYLKWNMMLYVYQKNNSNLIAFNRFTPKLLQLQLCSTVQGFTNKCGISRRLKKTQRRLCHKQLLWLRW